jgi:hypothetical protein
VKPVFGRAFLKLGQCLGFWGYMLELGGILGVRYGSKSDAFVSAFLGMSGASGIARQVLVDQAKRILEQRSLTSIKFWDYVGADLAARLGYTGDWSNLIMERGTQKIPPDVGRTNAWEYASDGAALGAMHPEIVRTMFEQTLAPVSEEKWQFWHAAGLDIGAEQPQTDYRQVEDTETKNFTEYCRQACPDLYSVLKT